MISKSYKSVALKIQYYINNRNKYDYYSNNIVDFSGGKEKFYYPHPIPDLPVHSPAKDQDCIINKLLSVLYLNFGFNNRYNRKSTTQSQQRDW